MHPGRAKRRQVFPIVSMTHICVLRPGENLDSPRVKAMTGPWVMVHFHAIAAGSPVRDTCPRRDALFTRNTRIPREYEVAASERYLKHTRGALHVRIASRAAVRNARDDSRDDDRRHKRRSRRAPKALESAGLSQIFVNPPMEGFSDCIEDISRNVIEKM